MIEMENKEELISSLFAKALLLLELFYDNENDYNLYIKDIERYCILLLTKYSIKKSTLRLQDDAENVLSCYNDKQFKSQFGMKRSTFDYILNIIRPSLIRSTCGRKRISPKKQFLIALWKMATSDPYRPICEKFYVGRATALMAVRRVIQAIAQRAHLFVKWPKGNRAKEIIRGFAATSAFPGIIGVVDNTHIKIKTPHINPDSYVNKKRQHSIQLQAVCDHELRFTHCLAGHVGSVPSQKVFRLSEVCHYLDDPEKFSNDSHLVGNAAYTIHEHLMTPFRENEDLTDRQKNYNFCHSSAEITIKRTFVLLKRRFQSLLKTLDMERIDLIPEFIIACCVLHNICLLQNDEFSIVESDVLETNNDIEIVTKKRNTNAGDRKRDKICNDLIMRNV
ncbi:PREDICTED: putative nuclease HARBI1 [Atta cephalotes]|uniref:Putative nuclease HARBI1 n=1 Tax=Atta cephalotes TaxID=12957 RepID=A0A158NMU6_ATTCE|nr:PREDICTED: putative nuclease HARBI1 [Atta cephalotes]XP_018049680.1 PREDICTED: putative nuclease HARBI1 [Atta colombica]